MPKKTHSKVGIKDADKPRPKTKKPTGKPPKQIRMLISCANQYRAFSEGDILDVPKDVRVDSARRWIRSGAAVKVK